MTGSVFGTLLGLLGVALILSSEIGFHVLGWILVLIGAVIIARSQGKIRKL